MASENLLSAALPAPTRNLLACDESGAKGYADKDEGRAGEVGVFAGFLIPEELLVATTYRLEQAVAAHRLADGKLHITDLEPAAQVDLRTRMFDAIRELRLPCFWYAIHVAGFHDFYMKFEALHASSRQEIAARHPHPRIKTGSDRSKPELLHNALFQGLFMHLIAFVEARAPGAIEIEVRTDRVDGPIAKLFGREAARLLDNSPRVHRVTGFDTVDNRVVEGQITGSTKWPDSMAIKTEVTALKINPTGDDDPLTIAADVLANSLCHLFHNRSAGDRYADLNRPSAIAAHPLRDNLDAFWDWGGADLVGDRLYRHPKAPPLP